MKRWTLIGWAAVLLVLLGVDRWCASSFRAHDLAAAAMADAGRAAARGQWGVAAEAYNRAVRSLPDDAAHRAARAQLALASDLAMDRDGHPADAANLIAAQVQQSEADPAIPLATRCDARRALAKLEYYNAWTLRLANAPAATWTVRAERARQQLAYVAEATHDAADVENLERSVRLIRMDLSELRDLPPPPDLPPPMKSLARTQNDDESDVAPKPPPKRPNLDAMDALEGHARKGS